VGLPSSAYTSTLRDLVEVVQDLDSATYLDQLIDLLEATAEAACPDREARGKLWGSVLPMVANYQSRLTVDRRAILTELAGVIGMRSELEAALPPLPASVDHQQIVVPAGYRIGMYTLKDSVGQRVKAALERGHPGIVVDVDNSHVATDALTNLARRANLFVVGWRAAKHAATDAISAARPAGWPTIFPQGKGSSSVLSAINEYLEGAFSQA
jgi:hypothetical protein